MSEIAVSEDTFVDRDGEVEEEEFEVRGAIMRWPQLKPYFVYDEKFRFSGPDELQLVEANVCFYEASSNSGSPPYEFNVTSSHITFTSEDGERFSLNVEELRPWPTRRSASGWVFMWEAHWGEGSDAFVFREQDLAEILEWVEESGY